MSAQERLDLPAQFRITTAGVIQKSSALGRRRFQRLREQFLGYVLPVSQADAWIVGFGLLFVQTTPTATTTSRGYDNFRLLQFATRCLHLRSATKLQPLSGRTRSPQSPDSLLGAFLAALSKESKLDCVLIGARKRWTAAPIHSVA